MQARKLRHQAGEESMSGKSWSSGKSRNGASLWPFSRWFQTSMAELSADEWETSGILPAT